MTNFDIAYNEYVKPNEGGYSFVEGDLGGETYAGIARNFHPLWDGWIAIDFEKRTKYGGSIPWNTKFIGLDELVKQFYKNLWEKNRLYEVQSQKLVNLIFDYIVHSGSAIKNIQKIVGVTPDGIIGPITLAAINANSPDNLFKKILDTRKALLIKQGEIESQKKFLSGWLKRLEKFYKEVNPTNHLVLVVIGFIISLIMISKK